MHFDPTAPLNTAQVMQFGYIPGGTHRIIIGGEPVYPFYHNGTLMLTVVIPVLFIIMIALMFWSFRSEDKDQGQ